MTITITSLLYTAAVCLLFYNVRETLRLQLLAAASIVYAFLLSRYAGIAVLSVSVYSWAAGLLIGTAKQKGKQKLCNVAVIIGILGCAAGLLVLKYLPGSAAKRWGSDHFFARLVLPVGFSYYIFQTISYLADLYSGRTKTIRNLFCLILYLAWFPRFISGPIERTGAFMNEIQAALQTRFREPERWTRAIHFIAAGCFMKLVIADRLALYTDRIFIEYYQHSAPVLLAGILFYTFQIYFDFAGYSSVAVGLSLAFGIRLTENFMTPYFSVNITEFWRRWHRSLSSWLRDYIYIPLGGNRHGKVRKMLNTMIVFLVCGAWHGAGWSFIAWGLLHGLYSAADSALRDRNVKFLREGIPGRILTFVCVSFAWVFFRAPSFMTALQYLKYICTTGIRRYTLLAEVKDLGLDKYEILIIIITVAVSLLLERAAYRKNLSVPEMTSRMRDVMRYSFVFLLLTAVIILGIYGPASGGGNMIYMQF